jgi:hypothetical protein
MPIDSEGHGDQGVSHEVLDRLRALMRLTRLIAARPKQLDVPECLRRDRRDGWRADVSVRSAHADGSYVIILRNPLASADASPAGAADYALSMQSSPSPSMPTQSPLRVIVTATDGVVPPE